MSTLSLDRIRRGLQSPNLFLREGNRLYYRFSVKFSTNNRDVDIFAEDWDNLLILDACRFDIFSDHHTLPGQLESKISPASSTVEFLEHQIGNRTLLDTVYVTANPQLYRNRDHLSAEFHDEIHIWKEEGWDEELRTVLPETVTEYALRANREYPNKRLLIHYIQPHYPFLGPTGRKYFEGGKLDFWQDLMTGKKEYDPDVLWDAFVENLKIAMPAVRDAMQSLEGKTVVTADHGQMLGERSWPFPIREYGHPRGIYTEELVKVPWLIYERGERREIRDEPQRHPCDTDVESDVITDRLESLGYK